MNKKTVEHIDKGVYIALIILAAAAIITAMICGPMGLESLANTASACACVIAGLVLVRTIGALRSQNERK